MIEKDVIKCGFGWYELYQPIIQKIIDHDKKLIYPISKIGVKSISSSHGMIQFFLIHPNNATKEIRDMITEAKLKSMEICEICGSKENIGYACTDDIYTCCEQCYNATFSKQENTRWTKRVTK